MLKVNEINTFYGRLHALWNVSLHADDGEIVALIGANGAGKSTFLKSVVGMLQVKSGSIEFDGRQVQGMKPNKLVRAGITLCPEGRQVFPRMTVQENLRVGGFICSPNELNDKYERVYELFPILKERRRQMAQTLSGGEQQMLAIGRSMMSSPKLLLLDEPSLGLSPILTEKIFELILRIRDQGVSVLLVEQNAVMALSIADRGYILETGRITHTGTGKELLESSEILESYLGAKSE